MHLRAGHTEMKPLHCLLPTLFALAALPSVAVGEDSTYSCGCSVEFYDVLWPLTERDCILVDNTFARTLNAYSTAHGLGRQALDVIVACRSESEETIPTRRRQLARREKTVKNVKKDLMMMMRCSGCPDDEQDLIPIHLNGRHLRSDGGATDNSLAEGGRMRRLSLSVEYEFCHALKTSGFDSFANMTACRLNCGTLAPMSVGVWVASMYTSPRAPPQLPTTVAPATATSINSGPPSYLFEGLENHVCRYSATEQTLGGPKDILTKEKDNKYFHEFDLITSEEQCQERCVAEGDDCCGYEYSGYYKQCELWKSAAGIGWMKQVNGYTCKEKKLDSPSEPQVEAVSLAVTGNHYRGKDNCACRSDPKDPFKGGPLDDEAKGYDNKYFNMAREAEGISTLDACQARCLANPHCIGVEWSESLKRCENWKDTAPGLGIGFMEELEGFQCYRRSVTAYDPVLQYGVAWEDDDDDEEATRASRFEMGAQWCDGLAASNVFSGHDIEGFQWAKVCGGFRYDKKKFASHRMGTNIDKVEDLPEAVKAEVLTYSAEVSKCWQKWSQFRATNSGQHPT